MILKNSKFKFYCTYNSVKTTITDYRFCF